MPYGNQAGKSQKAIYLGRDMQEKLLQCSIVLEKTGSDVMQEALEMYFMTKYREIRDSYGNDYWHKALERKHHKDKLGLRS